MLTDVVTRTQLHKVMDRWNNNRTDDRGASLVEYALLVTLIAVVCIVAVAFFGRETGETFSRVGESVQAT